MLSRLTDTIIVAGHYGSGKTNLSLNLALGLRKEGKSVTLCDLDVVNPYFRTADFRLMAEEQGIHLIAPAYAGSNLDIPGLTGELDARLGRGDHVIIDVGGDDDGAYALGRYAPKILQRPYTMLFVANFFRYLTRTPEEAAPYLAEIEAASRLTFTHIVNNSNLAGQTTRQDVENSIRKAEELSRLTGKPLLFTAVQESLAPALPQEEIFPVGIYVKTLWQS
ncbi:MAG: hypothetical protein ACOX0K_02805 [Oscillospiraceae bacterium]|jgi:hypothetical protein